MSASSLVSVARRSILPVTCLSLGAAAFLSGEHVLADLAGLPALGTLSAHAVALLVAAAFGVLFAITFAMNFFSKEAPVTTEPILHDLDEDLARALDELDHVPTQGRRGKHAADGPTAEAPQTERLADIISALRRAAAKAAEEKAAAQAALTHAQGELEAAHAQIAHLSAQASGQDGEQAAPVDVEALAAQIREEVQREALATIQDLSDSSDRLITSLKDGLARAEEQVEATRAQAADERADMLAAHAAEVAAVREQATAAEYERVKIAIKALNRTHADVLDPMQREAVERHQQRIIDAFDALDTEHRNVVLPTVPMPRLSASVPAVDLNSDEEVVEETEGLIPGKGNGRRLFRRR